MKRRRDQDRSYNGNNYAEEAYPPMAHSKGNYRGGSNGSGWGQSYSSNAYSYTTSQQIQQQQQPATVAITEENNNDTERFIKLGTTIETLLSRLSLKQEDLVAQGLAEGSHHKNTEKNHSRTKKSKKSSLSSSSSSSHPQNVDSMTASHEAKRWGLSDSLVSGIERTGFKSFFPIQREVIPYLIDSSTGFDPSAQGDVCVSAPTGSGKTLTYAIPLIDDIVRIIKSGSSTSVTSSSAGTATDATANNNSSSRRPLRALVLLPTRDLALQVHAVFQTLCENTGVQVGLAVGGGQSSFTQEREMLIGSSSSVVSSSTPSFCDILVCTPGRLVDHLDADAVTTKSQEDSNSASSSSSVSFSLTQLRWLVVDEADRLLAESYQGWVRRVNDAIFQVSLPLGGESYMRSVHDSFASSSSSSSSFTDFSRISHPTTARAWNTEGSKVGHVLTAKVSKPSSLSTTTTTTLSSLRTASWFPTTPSSSSISSSSSSLFASASTMPVPFRRIVCSATLTSNPQKLAALGLRQAKYFVSTASVNNSVDDIDGDGEEGEDSALGAGASSSLLSSKTTTRNDGKRMYTLPSTLHQAVTVCGAAEKPIVLLHLLRLLEGQHLSEEEAKKIPSLSGLRALVFAGSVETTHRLCRLLQLYGGLRGRVVEFSANLSQSKRSAVLAAAKAGIISVIVSSDAAARGLDLPSLPAVIHYDVAPRIKTYVHRVGRAARAGRIGITYTLARPEQMRHFKLVLARTVTSSPENALVKETLWSELVSQYAPRLSAVLGGLQRVLERERGGELAESEHVEALGEEELGASGGGGN